MSFLENIKLFFLKKKIRKYNSSAKRIIKLKEFNDIKTVGVLFDASDEEKYRRAAHLIRHFRGLNKKVNAIGVIFAKEDPHYLDTTLSYNYIKNKDVNWYYLPKSIFVDDFIKSEFDLLIDLNFDKIPSLRFITESSMSHCKVGLNQGDDDLIYDFMLEGIPPSDINMFLKQLLHYLELIKTQ